MRDSGVVDTVTYGAGSLSNDPVMRSNNHRHL